MGCRTDEYIQPRAFDALHDFVFVGSGPAEVTGTGQVDTSRVVKHEATQLPKPDRVVPNRQYVFLRRGTLDSESFAIEVLPQRLVKSGLRVARAPASANDLMQLTIGGPLFVVSFEQGGHAGIIFNQLDPYAQSGSGQWYQEAVVVVYTR